MKLSSSGMVGTGNALEALAWKMAVFVDMGDSRLQETGIHSSHSSLQQSTWFLSSPWKIPHLCSVM